MKKLDRETFEKFAAEYGKQQFSIPHEGEHVANRLLKIAEPYLEPKPEPKSESDQIIDELFDMQVKVREKGYSGYFADGIEHGIAMAVDIVRGGAWKNKPKSQASGSENKPDIYFVNPGALEQAIRNRFKRLAGYATLLWDSHIDGRYISEAEHYLDELIGIFEDEILASKQKAQESPVKVLDEAIAKLKGRIDGTRKICFSEYNPVNNAILENQLVGINQSIELLEKLKKEKMGEKE